MDSKQNESVPFREVIVNERVENKFDSLKPIHTCIYSKVFSSDDK